MQKSIFDPAQGGVLAAGDCSESTYASVQCEKADVSAMPGEAFVRLQGEDEVAIGKLGD